MFIILTGIGKIQIDYAQNLELVIKISSLSFYIFYSLLFCDTITQCLSAII